MSETPLELIQKQFQDLSQQVYDEEHKPILNLHVDVETVLDLRLGTLLSMIKTETEYEYILAKLENYEKALDRKVAKYFPALGFTEEQIIAFRADPRHHARIAYRSPMTQLQALLPTFLGSIRTGNLLCPTYNGESINLTFWSNDIELDVLVQARLCRALYETDQHVNFEFVTKPFGEVELPYIRKMHAWFLYDIEEFNSCPNVGTVMCTEYGMSQVIVMAMQRVSDEFADLPRTKIEEGLGPVVAGLNLVCEFNFFDYHIQREITPNG